MFWAFGRTIATEYFIDNNINDSNIDDNNIAYIYFVYYFQENYSSSAYGGLSHHGMSRLSSLNGSDFGVSGLNNEDSASVLGIPIFDERLRKLEDKSSSGKNSYTFGPRKMRSFYIRFRLFVVQNGDFLKNQSIPILDLSWSFLFDDFIIRGPKKWERIFREL
jgi:hypothetical protein